jgi:hypothetical protein
MVAYQPLTAFGLARQAEYQPNSHLVLASGDPLANDDYTPSVAVVIALAEGYAVTADFRLPVDTFIPPSLITLQLSFSLAWRLWVSAEMPLSQHWSLQANPVWTPVISATVYRFALENSQGRAEMPISNFSGQLRSGEPSYLQVTIPDARRWAQDIADFAAQSDTEMVIQAGYRYSDGRVKTQDIARTRLRNVRYDLGARSSSVQLDGIDTRINPTPKSVTLTGANYRSQDESGWVRYRCAMNFDIRPGDTALINGESFQVGELSYNVSVNNATLEIAA